MLLRLRRPWRRWCGVTERFGRTSDERRYISEVLEAGVKGYVLKSWTFGDLIQAIKQVSRGQPYFSPGVSAAVVEVFHSKSERRGNLLTVRERQVLQLIAEWKSTKDIAAVLGRTVKTAESHGTNE